MAILNSRMQYWLKTDTVKISLTEKPLFEVTENNNIGTNSTLNYLSVQSKETEARSQIYENELLPSFYFGYAVQVFSGAKVYNGLEIGFFSKK